MDSQKNKQNIKKLLEIRKKLFNSMYSKENITRLEHNTRLLAMVTGFNVWEVNSIYKTGE